MPPILSPALSRSFGGSRETPAAPERIWHLWTDVPKWKDWDTGLRDARISGSFTVGAVGEIVDLGGREVPFRITACTPGSSYTYRVALPLAALLVTRSLRGSADRTTFTHEVRFVGLLGYFFAFVLGRNFQKLLPGVLDNVKRLAETP